jgi:hypothetical protein
MKRAAATLLAIASVWLIVDVLADATQTRPDRPRAAARTEVVFSVSTKPPDRSKAVAAQGLWGTCHGFIYSRTVSEELTDLGEGRFRVVVRPALGDRARRRLEGCMKDATLERVRGNLLEIRDVGSGRQRP